MEKSIENNTKTKKIFDKKSLQLSYEYLVLNTLNGYDDDNEYHKDHDINHLIKKYEKIQYECSEKNCKEKFPTNELLKEHTKSHIEKYFICSVCNLNFSRQYSLTVHERVHTGERPYK